MNSQDLLTKVRQVYKGFATYSDTGTVEITPPVRKVHTEFTTHFLMPSKFRFMWREWHPYFGASHTPNEHIIWSNGEDTHQLILGALTHPELSMSIAAAAGVSEGSIMMILPLLLRDRVDLPSLPHNWAEMQNAKIQSEELVNGFHCYHLLGKLNNNDSSEVWIGKDDYVVRKLITKISTPVSGMEERLSELMSELKKSGQNLDGIPTNFQDFKEYLPKTPDIQYVYNYQSVVVDKPMQIELFDFDPNNPPKVSSWAPIK